jgi:hypothetical protein
MWTNHKILVVGYCTLGSQNYSTRPLPRSHAVILVPRATHAITYTCCTIWEPYRTVLLYSCRAALEPWEYLTCYWLDKQVEKAGGASAAAADVTNSNVTNSDVANSDVANSDVAKSDVANSDVANSKLNSDVMGAVETFLAWHTPEAPPPSSVGRRHSAANGRAPV